MLVSNEASAGFMADVCARITGGPGACYGTFGPGATNLTTGVGCAFLDRSPVLAFTNEMSDAMNHRTTQMRIDHQALFRPLTKWTTRLRPESLEETFHEAVHVALSEVPGPVHIGLPSDVGPMPARESGAVPVPVQGPPGADEARLEEMVRIFCEARTPLLAVGLSAVRAGVKDLVRGIAEKFGVPVVLTPMAKGMVPEGHPWYGGVLFHALSDRVAETTRLSDLVVGIGYDPVEFNYEDWLPSVPVIHIDTVPADLDTASYGPACDVVGDIAGSLRRLAAVERAGTGWDLRALASRREAMFEALRPPRGSFGPRAALAVLREMLPDDGVMTCDVGAHTHLIGQAWRTPEPGLQLMTNGWSSMGFAVPSAIAAKLCLPDRAVACVVGDGGFLMMAGEMATAMRLGTHVVFVVLTDGNLSLIRVKQVHKGVVPYGTLLHGPGYASSGNFFGVPVLEAGTADAYAAALEEAFGMDGPVIVEARVDGGEYDHLVQRAHK